MIRLLHYDPKLGRSAPSAWFSGRIARASGVPLVLCRGERRATDCSFPGIDSATTAPFPPSVAPMTSPPLRMSHHQGRNAIETLPCPSRWSDPMASSGYRSRGSWYGVDEEEWKVLDPVGFGGSGPFLPRPLSRKLKRVNSQCQTTSDLSELTRRTCSLLLYL